MKTIKTMKKGGAKSKCKPVAKMSMGGGNASDKMFKTGGTKMSLGGDRGFKTGGVKMSMGGSKGFKTGGTKKQMGGTSSGFDPKAAKSDTDHLCDAYSKFGGPVKKKTVKAKKMQRGGGVIAKKGGSLKSKGC